LLERLKSILGGSTTDRAATNRGGSRTGSDSTPAGEPFVRQSNGLDQFFSSLSDRTGLSILDFAAASQENVSFITNMGHRLSSQDFVRAMEQTFGRESPFEGQADPLLADQFVQNSLDFPPDAYDGALVWDALQYLSPHLLQIAVDRLYDTLRPNAYLLAFFYADERAREVPLYHYRIAGYKSLMLSPRGHRPPGQFFNNRALEKLFHRFQTVKFFLARDSLREVIVRR
jgi:hypothetical protein